MVTHVEFTAHARVAPHVTYAVEAGVEHEAMLASRRELRLWARCFATADCAAAEAAAPVASATVCVVQSGGHSPPGRYAPGAAGGALSTGTYEVCSDPGSVSAVLNSELVLGFKYSPALQPMATGKECGTAAAWDLEDLETVRYLQPATAESRALLQGKALAVLYRDPCKLGERPETERVVGAASFTAGAEGPVPGFADGPAVAAVLLDACEALAPAPWALSSFSVSYVLPAPLRSCLALAAAHDAPHLATVVPAAGAEAGEAAAAKERVVRAQLLAEGSADSYVEAAATYNIRSEGVKT